MNSVYKLIVLVMCSSKRHFRKLEMAIKSTWASNEFPDIKIIFYVDNEDKLIKRKAPYLKNGWDLILPCKDGYNQCTEKTLLAFEYVAVNYEFQYICRTNLGSYINLNKILDFLSGKPGKKFYSGIIGYSKDSDISFASGSCYFLSKDLVELCVSERYKFDLTSIDDIALGKFMALHQIGIDQQANRLSFTDHGVEYHTGSQKVGAIDDSLIYHVRLRSNDREQDIEKMQALYNLNF